MVTLWFWLVALLLIVYVVLDGFDLGAGILHLIVARTDRERRTILQSVGPVWDGNEVWLVAAAGTTFCVFPVLFAVSFSGFYLPLMMVLWLLVGRAIGIEFRGQIDGRVWNPFWDVVFSLSSGLLAFFFGVALGNVVRGVPLGPEGTFFEPLWTDFSPFHATGILDPYTILTGFTAVAALALHGSLWLALKTGGDVHLRSRRLTGPLLGAVAALTILTTIFTTWVQPHVIHRMKESPMGFLLAAAAMAGLGVAWRSWRREEPLRAFLGSSIYLAGMVALAAFGVYPYVLPSSTGPGLTAEAAAAGAYGLRGALWWWIPGVALAAGYFTILYRRTSGKVVLEDEEPTS